MGVKSHRTSGVIMSAKWGRLHDAVTKRVDDNRRQRVIMQRYYGCGMMEIVSLRIHVVSFITRTMKRDVAKARSYVGNLRRLYCLERHISVATLGGTTPWELYCPVRPYCVKAISRSVRCQSQLLFFREIIHAGNWQPLCRKVDLATVQTYTPPCCLK